MDDSDSSVPEASGEPCARSADSPPRTPLWTLKATQFFGTAAAACLNRYITVYYSMIGLSRFNIGLLVLIGPLMNFVGAMFWSAIIDRFGDYKRILTVTIFFGSISTFAHLLDVFQKSLPLLIILTLVWNFLLSTTGPIIDALCLQVLKEHKDTNEDYGDQRLWSAAGWGMMSLLTGQMIDTFGKPFMFVGFSICQFANILVILMKLPAPDGANTQSSVHQSNGAAGRSLFSFSVVWFLLNLLQYGIAMSLVENFLLVFLLEDFDNTPKLLLGASVAVMCLFEIPVFKYVGRLWTEYGFDLVCVITMCQLILILRFFLYFFLPRSYPWLVLLIEPLHGVTFGAMWAASVEYGQQLAPPGATARMQGLVQGIYYQVAMGIGSLFWGSLVVEPPHGFGFKPCFLIDAALLLVWCAIWQICLRVKGRASRSGGPESAAREVAREPLSSTSLQPI